MEETLLRLSTHELLQLRDILHVIAALNADKLKAMDRKTSMLMTMNSALHP